MSKTQLFALVSAFVMLQASGMPLPRPLYFIDPNNPQYQGGGGNPQFRGGWGNPQYQGVDGGNPLYAFGSIPRYSVVTQPGGGGTTIYLPPAGYQYPYARLPPNRFLGQVYGNALTSPIFFHQSDGTAWGICQDATMDLYFPESSGIKCEKRFKDGTTEAQQKDRSFLLSTTCTMDKNLKIPVDTITRACFDAQGTIYNNIENKVITRKFHPDGRM